MPLALRGFQFPHRSIWRLTWHGPAADTSDRHSPGTPGSATRQAAEILVAEQPSFRAMMDDLLAGREEAAEQIVEEYTSALVAVARRQIGARLARRVDAEDVVQSVYRSLFVRARRGEYELGSGRDLWKLLVTITLNKVRRQAKFHKAGRRDMMLERSATTDTGQPAAEQLARANEPTPDEAAGLVDEVQTFLEGLPERDRSIVELRLQGLTSAEIAAETGRAERSVRRVLEQIQKRLASRREEA